MDTLAMNIKNKQNEIFTTGQVSKICSVATRTVCKWFDSGQLKGYRLPSSGDRRIPVAELERFMRAHNMPIQNLFGNEDIKPGFG